MVENHQLAELRELFPEHNQIQLHELLKGIDKDILKRIATYFIGQELYSKKATDHQNLIEHWFTEGNRVFAEDLLNRIDTYERTKQRTLKIVYIISMLNILQAALELEDEGALEKKSDEETERDLFLAMLLANQNMEDLKTKDLNKIQVRFPDIAVEAGLLCHSFSTNDIMNFDLSDYGFCQSIKALLLFVFLESTEQGQMLLARFYQHFEIKHWRDYFNHISPYLHAWTHRDQASSIDLILGRDTDQGQAIAFIKKFAVDSYARMEDVDYIKLRERPMLELTPNTFRIIHPLFLVDKIYKGLFFLLKTLNEIPPKIITHNFRSWYTSHFSELECFNNLIDYSICDADFKVYDEDLRRSGVIAPPDCYLRTGGNVFLFESKDIFINAKIKSGGDFDNLLRELKKKLLIEENGRPVGIGQLINSIRNVLTGKDTYDTGFLADQMTIYPIIITHDPMFDAPGLNKVLQSFFSDELAKLRAEGIETSRIKPLVIINVDTLILVAHLLRSNQLRLEELLEAYFENCRYPKKDFYASKSEYMHEFYDSCLPLHGYFPHFLNAKLRKNWKSVELMLYFFHKFQVDGREHFRAPSI